MKMKNICYILFLLVSIVGCRDNTVIHNNNIVNSYTDSIYETSKPYLRFVYENVKVSEYPYDDSSNVKRQMWIYGDTINKYSSNDKLYQLASSHKSLAVRYVAFKLLLKRDSHRAISYLIRDINNKDTVSATRLDESNPESFTGLRVELAQYRKKYNVSVEDSIALDKAILNSKIKENIRYYPYLMKKLSKKCK